MVKAKETTEKIDIELKDLQATLANIEDARPFEDLTVRSSCTCSYHQTHPIRLRQSGGGGWQRPPAHCRGRREHDQEGQVDSARYDLYYWLSIPLC